MTTIILKSYIGIISTNLIITIVTQVNSQASTRTLMMLIDDRDVRYQLGRRISQADNLS